MGGSLIFTVACRIFSCGMWDLSSLTRDRTQAPLHWDHGVLATGPPGKFSHHQYGFLSQAALSLSWLQMVLTTCSQEDSFNKWIIDTYHFKNRASQGALVVKKLPANAGDIRDIGSIPGWGRSPRREHGNSLQYSCLENPINSEVWLAAVHRVAQSQTLCNLACMHARTFRRRRTHVVSKHYQLWEKDYSLSPWPWAVLF